MTNKPMLSERDKFEEFWRSTMNVQDMDLHRCEFPMTAYDDQPYACHETERGRMAWMARALLDKPAAQHQGEPVAWVNGEQLRLCAKSPRHDEPENPMVHNLPRNIAGSALRTDYCDSPLYAEQPAPLAVDAEILERFPEINFANYGQEEVEALQAWAFEAYEAIARLNGVKP